MSGAGAHQKAVERRKAHGGLDAGAVPDGAEAVAGSEVGDDDPTARQVGIQRREAAGDVLVREAVEAVAAHALVVERPGQSDPLRDRRLPPMEGRVETGDLRQVRPRGGQGPDRGETLRLVQRRQRNERLQRRHDLRRQPHGRMEVGAAVHDAVAGADQVPAGGRLIRPRQGGGDSGFGAAVTVDLGAADRRGLTWGNLEEGGLEVRGPRVEREHQAGHG